MADVLLEKNIYFLGSWKANRLSDHLLHEITAHGRDNRGAPSKLQVLPQGIRLSVNENSDKSQKSGIIPQKNVLEIKQNRLQANCILCVLKEDSTLLLNIVVWRCTNEVDVFDILKFFSRTHNNNNNLSNGHGMISAMTDSGPHINGDVILTNGEFGEIRRVRKNVQGRTLVTSLSQTTSQDNHVTTSKHNSAGNNKVKIIDFHTNAQQKEDIDQIKVIHVPRGSTSSSQNHVDDVFVQTRSENSLDSMHIKQRDVSVQTDLREMDADSIASGLQDEISVLQREVKELKLIVHSSVAVSGAEYFQRRHVTGSRYVHVGPKGQTIVPSHGQYDARSFASQTEMSRRMQVSRRQTRPDQRMVVLRRSRGHSEPRYASHISARSQRYQSDSRMHGNHGYFVVPHNRSVSSSSSGSLTKKMMQYVTLPPDGRAVHGEGRLSWRSDPRKSAVFLNSTVERPIEDVYGHSRSRRRFEQKQQRSRKVITPNTFVVHDDAVPVTGGSLLVHANGDYHKESSLRNTRTNSEDSGHREEKPPQPEMGHLEVPEIVYPQAQLSPREFD